MSTRARAIHGLLVKNEAKGWVLLGARNQGSTGQMWSLSVLFLPYCFRARTCCCQIKEEFLSGARIRNVAGCSLGL